MNDFAGKILKWSASHGRNDLPWQQQPTAYRVWISEIMLQQTQVTTVIPYYLRFMESFPDANALSGADIDDVLHRWSGLGYYARARNLHKAATIIRDQFAGEFPSSFDDVVNLPGIGRSTAGAILALSRDERQPILDGNVKRVLARYHAVAGWPGKTAVSRALWEYAEQHTPAENVAAYTQAMMDLGAVLADEAVYLERRPPSGIWGGLWSFPELEPQQDVSSWCREKLKAAPVELQQWPTVRHSFTHYDLDIMPIAVRLQCISGTVADTDDQMWYEFDSPQQVGIAAPVTGLLEKLKTDELLTNVTDS